MCCSRANGHRLPPTVRDGPLVGGRAFIVLLDGLFSTPICHCLVFCVMCLTHPVLFYLVSLSGWGIRVHTSTRYHPQYNTFSLSFDSSAVTWPRLGLRNRNLGFAISDVDLDKVPSNAVGNDPTREQETIRSLGTKSRAWAITLCSGP